MTSAREAFRTLLLRTMRFDLVLLALELLVTVAFFIGAFMQPYAVAVEGAQNLLYGQLALPFIAGFLVCGIVLPASLEAGVMRIGIRSQLLLPTASVLVLVGALCMRYAIVFAAAHPAVWIGA